LRLSKDVIAVLGAVEGAEDNADPSQTGPHTAIVNVKTANALASLLLAAMDDELAVLPWALARLPAPRTNGTDDRTLHARKYR